MRTNTNRRRFLKSVPAGAAGLAAFLETREILAASSSELGGWSTGPDAFEQLRSQYSLLPEITYFNHAQGSCLFPF